MCENSVLKLLTVFWNGYKTVLASRLILTSGMNEGESIGRGVMRVEGPKRALGARAAAGDRGGVL